MKKKRVVDVVDDILTPYIGQFGLELVDVEFVKEGPYRYLRVTIDKEDAVTLDDCQLVSQYLNKKLDAADPIEEQYFLEVTSPGIERTLKKDKEFERFKGSKVQLKLFQPFEGQKLIIGKLIGMVDDQIVIENDALGRVEISKSKVALTKLVVDFEDIEDIEEEGEQ
ncbi:MAG: ribosome maturation factor RimP [Bacillota bacterium]|nr:ribosome maturation factor RimP [Bacillota bacterium]